MKSTTTLICEQCGKTFERIKSDVRKTGRYFCSRDCMNLFRRTPENTPSWNGGKIKQQCVVCGELFDVPPHDAERRKTCCMECRNVYISEWQKKYCWLKEIDSNLHPNWHGGVSYEKYPKEFFDIRMDIIERDCRCVECESTEDLCVHHIDYNKKNNNYSNLITLCRSCHSKTNYNRKKWKRRYEEYAICNNI